NSPMGGYQRNEETPLDGDVLIVDECSMIDLMLMYNLLKAIPENMTLIMVGDIDQLPSVSAGNVLKDIINSECVPVVRLTRIFRQAQNSRIIMNAHRINEGKPLDMRGGKDSDFFFAERSEPEEIVSMVVQYVSQNLPKYYGVDPIKDIQVLSPMKRGVCGTINLNVQLQAVLNAQNAKTRIKHGGTELWLHDKVMQIKNNYTKDVFNGDIGIVSDINNEDQELTISFDGKEVIYVTSELDEVVLAYATTIHKAQGSEFPIVVMPFSMSHYMMLQRNLLYTGVTRAKKVLFLIGEKEHLVAPSIMKQPPKGTQNWQRD
ncbi:MAG: ATP-dependent RecD-like DNA helicase, partial [Clostridiales bacterium]|nr:ATP-dependent RecD-like DNA helicase [Clostridiales bacterium]